MSRPEYVILRSKDEVPIEVESQILGKCAVLGIDTTCDVDKELPPVEIPIHNVTEAVLRKVLEWLEHHRDDNEMDETSEWNLRFINVDQEMLFEIILAANYLDIKPLLNIACGSVANMIKGKTPEEIRKIFKIANDSTTEEEA